MSFLSIHPKAKVVRKPVKPGPFHNMSREEIYKRFEQVTDEEWHRVMKLEQHLESGPANPEWLKAREGVITGSKVSGIMDHGFENPDSLLQDMLWKCKYVNPIYTGHGNRHEECAEAAFVAMMQMRVENPNDTLVEFDVHEAGLIKSRERGFGWIGYSPDGISYEWHKNPITGVVTPKVNLVEYKCPYGKKDVPFDYSEPLYGPIRVPSRWLDNDKTIPNPTYTGTQKKIRWTRYYLDQVNWGMGLLLREKILTPNPICHLVVWTFGPVQFDTVDFDKHYYEYQRSMAEDFWKNRFVTGLLQKSEGLLDYKQITPTLHI